MWKKSGFYILNLNYSLDVKYSVQAVQYSTELEYIEFVHLINVSVNISQPYCKSGSVQ